MHRSYNPKVLGEAVLRYKGWDEEAGFDPKEWLDIDENLMLVDGENVGLLTCEYPGLYNGHWFFTARGREALYMAAKMLSYAFEVHNARAIRGLTPLSLRNARWLAKQLGFKSHGTLEYHDREPEELMILTKEDFEAKYGS
jgi:hypothetical protein